MVIKAYRAQVLLIVAFLTLPLQLIGQKQVVTLPLNAKGQVEYVDNLTIPNTSQPVLYKRALHWAVGSSSYKFVRIGLEDRDFGRFIASGKLLYGNDEVFISLTIDVKNNKASIKINNFDYNMSPGNIPLANLNDQKAKEAQTLTPKVSAGIQQLLKGFEAAMLNASKAELTKAQ